MVKYFRDFRKFHNDHENFCHEIVLTAAYKYRTQLLKITENE